MSVNTIRQSDIIPPDKLDGLHVIVVGCGAIGRQVCLDLASFGVPKFTIVDFDKVDDTNRCTQGYGKQDVDVPKVDVVKTDMLYIDDSLDVEAIESRFRGQRVTNDAIVFMCVDNMDARRFIWDKVKHNAAFVVDGRMLGESMRVLTWTKRWDWEFESELDSRADVLPGRCTGKGTIYCASICSGLMVTEFSKWLRGYEPDKDVSLGLFSMDMSVS